MCFMQCQNRNDKHIKRKLISGRRIGDVLKALVFHIRSRFAKSLPGNLFFPYPGMCVALSALREGKTNFGNEVVEFGGSLHCCKRFLWVFLFCSYEDIPLI